MTVQRFAALSSTGPITNTPDFPKPHLVVSTEVKQTVAAKFAVDTQTKLLALCPGAEYGPAKQWPSKYFAQVAQVKHAQGWQVGLFGSAKDKPIAEAINQASGAVCHDFTGRTDLAEAVALLALADSVVSNDSGLMHVAAALDKPLLALFGSSSPKFTPPLSDKAQVISLHLSCAPCFKRVCPLYAKDDSRYLECLTGIKPEQILTLLPS
ncbi:lipopolysaccharide heptosyltransferase II [Methylocucumis oryzae]|uniref:lipopolysaccharide heptosyltransferase II n=1 Tax=Methylocucumis oryzae TaxID=1632867 RepID=UPI0023BA4E84|nr:lipopolysaccharide heptosyltransferase II [Methylocucumis oryzae]